MSFDIKKHNPTDVAEAGFEFTVVLPDGTETDAKIKVRGSNSPKVKDFYRKAFTEMQMKESAAKRRGKEADPMSLDESEDFAVRSSAVRIISWSNFEEDGKPVVFSKAEAERMMQAYPFLREIVTKESEEITNFRHNLDK
jgi:hypothetical protein